MHRNIREGSELNVRHNLGLKYLGLITAIEKNMRILFYLVAFVQGFDQDFFKALQKVNCIIYNFHLM